jgi:paraquat-inducible protein B
LTQKLENLPIEKIAGKLGDILETLDQLLGDPEIKEMRHNLNTASQKLNRLLENADTLVLDVNRQVKEVAGNLNSNMGTLTGEMQATLTDGRTLIKDASKDLDGVSSDARKLLQDLDVQMKPLLKDIQEALVSAKKAMDGATNTMGHVDSLVGERSNTRQKLNRTLDEFSAAAKSLESLMDYLERHPESLLKGKGGAR